MDLKTIKKVNNILGAENTKKNIANTRFLLNEFTREYVTYNKNEWINLKKYLDNNQDIVIEKFTSKKGNVNYILKNGNRNLQLTESKLEYAIINKNTKKIVPNFGYQALEY